MTPEEVEIAILIVDFLILIVLIWWEGWGWKHNNKSLRKLIEAVERIEKRLKRRK